MSNATPYESSLSCWRRYQRRCRGQRTLSRLAATAGGRQRIVMFKFRLGAVIDVPTDVFPSGKAQLFGVEEGLHNRHLSAKFGTGYVYTLREANADGTPLHGMQLVHSMEHRLASEEEIESWKKSVQSASNANANH